MTCAKILNVNDREFTEHSVGVIESTPSMNKITCLMIFKCECKLEGVLHDEFDMGVIAFWQIVLKMLNCRVRKTIMYILQISDLHNRCSFEKCFFFFFGFILTANETGQK